MQDRQAQMSAGQTPDCSRRGPADVPASSVGAGDHGLGYEDGRFKEIPSADVSDLVGADNRILWVDVVDPTEDDLACVQEEFSLHPLAMEDIRERHQRPKIETYPSHSFLVAYTRNREELEMFVGPGWLVTVGPEGYSTASVRARFERTHVSKPTVGYLVYVLLDEIVDGYFNTTDEIEDLLEDLEERIFSESIPAEEDIQADLFDGAAASCSSSAGSSSPSATWCRCSSGGRRTGSTTSPPPTSRTSTTTSCGRST